MTNLEKQIEQNIRVCLWQQFPVLIVNALDGQLLASRIMDFKPFDNRGAELSSIRELLALAPGKENE